MEARIIRGAPKKAAPGRNVWQLETRIREPIEWDTKFGTGYTSTKPEELREFARGNGWRMVEDHSRDPDG